MNTLLMLRRVLPFVIAVLFFLLAAQQPAQRVTWIALGVVFLALGAHRVRTLR